MPLTAVRTGSVIDASNCGEDVWFEIYRRRPRVRIYCRQCHSSMHARKSKLGLRHFAHDDTQSKCPGNGETPEHERLKVELAAAVRAAGWQAELEVTGGVEGNSGWRADILATEPNTGRRIIFEAQLSRMTLDEGNRRIEKYRQDGIESYWVTNTNSNWLWKIPGFKVESVCVDANEQLQKMVTRGIASFREHESELLALRGEPLRYLEWAVRNDLSLEETVAAILNRDLVSHHISDISEILPWGSSTRWVNNESACALVRTDDVERERKVFELRERNRLRMEKERLEREAQDECLRLERTRQFEDQQKRQQFAATTNNVTSSASIIQVLTNRAKQEPVRSGAAVNVHPILERQNRILHLVHFDALTAADDNGEIWIGNPPRLFGDNYAVTTSNGNAQSAHGAILWTGNEGNLHKFCIICPVVALSTPELGKQWREENIHVYVQGDFEASELALAINWNVDEIRVCHPTLELQT